MKTLMNKTSGKKSKSIIKERQELGRYKLAKTQLRETNKYWTVKFEGRSGSWELPMAKVPKTWGCFLRTKTRDRNKHTHTDEWWFRIRPQKMKGGSHEPGAATWRPSGLRVIWEVGPLLNYDIPLIYIFYMSFLFSYFFFTKLYVTHPLINSIIFLD